MVALTLLSLLQDVADREGESLPVFLATGLFQFDCPPRRRAR
jgi:hypothetical protein